MPRRKTTSVRGSKAYSSEGGIKNTASLKSPGLKREADSQIPVNFTWTDQKNTDCPISKIRDQSNCASSWVSFVFLVNIAPLVDMQSKYNIPTKAITLLANEIERAKAKPSTDDKNSLETKELIALRIKHKS